ncbi:hypothetical protein CYMTET_4797 [Cymbomonas tetramitiformis]|uniref:PsbP C-terminal domain-containing protein n=1 Tax=Cymbomonas tetramitiformis TaxID=36881 RepID=A0AAE0H0R0_9CHLO|nr:hypothetical protein CYMTET_4797 [Cymbomonas tetramitiformis]
MTTDEDNFYSGLTVIKVLEPPTRDGWFSAPIPGKPVQTESLSDWSTIEDVSKNLKRTSQILSAQTSSTAASQPCYDFQLRVPSDNETPAGYHEVRRIVNANQQLYLVKATVSKQDWPRLGSTMVEMVESFVVN